MTATRVEKDSMGEMTVPAEALYGATTQRAVENFPISGRPVPAEIIHAFGLLKKACAETNLSLKKLDEPRAKAIIKAAEAIAQGKHDREFPIDIFQTGSGTSTNMNVNEVIANLTCLAAKKSIGSRDHKNAVHPNDHVNMGQSSNDTFPTAMQVAAAVAIDKDLIPALTRLAKELNKKARQWDKIVKVGRTHLMDATPIRLGQQFSGYAAAAEYGVMRARRAMQRLAENLPIGGTAVGTGINTHPKFGRMVCEALSKATGVKFAEAPNHFEAQATRDCVVEASGELKTIAVALSKIANDIRWLGSGPRCGLFELSLPATQPGSSIMPGKVNPVMCESMMQVACQVIGNDAAVTLGGLGGIGSLFELNVAMPMMADNMQTSIRLLANASNAFVDKLVVGLEVNEKIATGFVERSLMLCTKLAPVIGYDAAAKAAKAAFDEGVTIREYCRRHNLVDEKTLDKLLDAKSMTEPDKT
ncbi:MAG: class II fumarate hydratase [Phycisphaerales bacterium]|nr:class II fumarate hydratase [Phycisphaerales bacterium]